MQGVFIFFNSKAKTFDKPNVPRYVVIMIIFRVSKKPMMKTFNYNTKTAVSIPSYRYLAESKGRQITFERFTVTASSSFPGP